MRGPVSAFFVSLVFVGLVLGQDSLNVRHIGGCVLPMSLHAVGVAVSGDYAYLACWADPPDTVQGLRVFSISDPTQPAEVGYWVTPGPAQAVVVSGDYAYVADDTCGLRVISVADPAHPVEAGHIDLPGRTYALAVAGSFAYTVDPDVGGLRIISVSDPTNPVEVGYCSRPAVACGVAVAEQYAYVIGDSFVVIDIADSAHPLQMGSCNETPVGRNVAVTGDYAYFGGLHTVRVFDPSRPVEVWASDGVGNGVAAGRGRLYVAADVDGLRVYLLTDPGSPAMDGFYKMGGSFVAAYGVAVAGDYAYVAYDKLGLQVFEYIGAGIQEVADSACHLTDQPTMLTHASAAKVLFSGCVFDATGRRVRNLEPGIYFLREAKAQAQAVRKVVVTR